MVRELQVDGRAVHLCEECGLGYETPTVAKECEDFCREHDACSWPITRQAVYRPTRAEEVIEFHWKT